MRLETCRRAVEELRGEGFAVNWLYLGLPEIEELLGVEVAHQAEASSQDDPDLEPEVGQVDGMPVILSRAMNPYFVVWKDPKPDEQGMVPVSSDRGNRRYFHASGECLQWLTVDPVGTIMEACDFEGWRPTWIRLPKAFREYARDEPGVQVIVGGPSQYMVIEGNDEKVRVVMFDSDGLSAAWLATLPVDTGPLDEILGQVRDHVGWTGHRNLGVEYKTDHGIEGWVSHITCDEAGCGWSVGLSELVGAAAGSWDLVGSESGLIAEVRRLAEGPVYERTADWQRLVGED